MYSKEVNNFFDFTLSELTDFFKERQEKPYRATQIFKWVYAKNVYDVEAMTDLAKDFRAEVQNWLSFELPALVDHRISKDGTQKFLFDVGDGLTVETVMIPTDNRKTLCVSSEVGCNLGCKFCYTGKEKLKKRLSAGQIVGQFLQVKNILEKQDQSGLTNVVFMGMGEPLDNPKAVFDSIEILNQSHGLNFSRKRITVSTSGLVPMIPLISNSGARLAISLNGSNDKVRSEIMPINRKWPIQNLLQASEKHTQLTGQDVTFEYVLLKGLTDQKQHAFELAQLLKGQDCMINLIPFNEHPGSGYEKPEDKDVLAFQNYLLRKGFTVYVRQTRGEDIFAACGQLNAVNQDHFQYKSS